MECSVLTTFTEELILTFCETGEGSLISLALCDFLMLFFKHFLKQKENAGQTLCVNWKLVFNNLM